MEKNNDLYIGSISPTIGVKEQRILTEMGKQLNGMLTMQEYTEIATLYGRAIDRILKENGLEEKNNETESTE